MSITDDLRMAMARVWDEWADLHGVAAPAHIVDTWLSVTIAADALDAEVAALTAQLTAARESLAGAEARIEAGLAWSWRANPYPESNGDLFVDLRAALAGASPVAADPPEQEPKRHAGAFFDHIEKYGSPAVKAAARRAEQELAADPPTEDAQPVDLMANLRASIDAAKAARSLHRDPPTEEQR